MKVPVIAGALAVSLGLVVLAARLSPELPVDDAKWPSRYDHHFKRYAKRYFGVGFDWRWFKAQGVAESGLRPGALSHRGASGLMQILPSTFAEIWDGTAIMPGITEVRWSIASGIAYDRYLFDRWESRVADSEHLAFTLASYNAGFTGVLRARKRAAANGRDRGIWSQVAPHAPEQTRRYVRRIQALMAVAD